MNKKNRLKPWRELPYFMQVPQVEPYYEILNKHRAGLVMKRLFDIVLSSLLLAVLCVPMLLAAAAVKMDTPGPVFYRQTRVTAFGRKFTVIKFRTMYHSTGEEGPDLTLSNDRRITRTGKILRKYRLDEFPQLLNILAGDMSFVGTRPEIMKYVKKYTPEMRATLLLPAGLTSEASIRYKDESRLLENASDADAVYVNEILPAKMAWNLESIRKFGFFREILTIVRTVLAVYGRKEL